MKFKLDSFYRIEINKFKENESFIDYENNDENDSVQSLSKEHDEMILRLRKLYETKIKTIEQMHQNTLKKLYLDTLD